MKFGAEAGIWKVIQDAETLKMSLLKYGKVVETWDAEKMYSFDELMQILETTSAERRGEK